MPKKEPFNGEITPEKLHEFFQKVKSCKERSQQKVRRTVDVKYGGDYSELSVLRSVAYKLGIAMLF